MEEKDFAQKITRSLNWGLAQIEDDKLAKLRASRAKAINAYREPINVLGMVTVNGNVFNNAYSVMKKNLIWLPLVALLLYVASMTVITDATDPIGEVDAALIGQELPIDAFLDKDLESWIKDSE